MISSYSSQRVENIFVFMGKNIILHDIPFKQP